MKAKIPVMYLDEIYSERVDLRGLRMAKHYLRFLDVEVEVVTDRNNATIAVASLLPSELNEEIMAKSSAIRNPQDKYNFDVGYMLAVGRVLESLGKKMQKRAWGLVKQADNVKTLKAEAKSSKKK